MEHEFYNLDEAAELLECKVYDLLKWGMTGKIDLCIWYRGQLDRYSIPDEAFTGRPAPEKDETVDEFLPILKEDIKRFIFSRGSRSNENIEIEQIMWPGCDYPLFLLRENIFNDDSDTQIIEITKNDLYIMSEPFEKLKAELHGSPVVVSEQCVAEKIETPRIGGAKKHPFQAAIEKAYLYFLENNNSFILKPGKLILFIEELEILHKKENTSCSKANNEQETINYIAERIKSVKKLSGKWKINTQNFQSDLQRGRSISYESRSYEEIHVSKQLTLLRKKHPLPLSDSHS